MVETWQGSTSEAGGTDGRPDRLPASDVFGPMWTGLARFPVPEKSGKERERRRSGSGRSSWPNCREAEAGEVGGRCLPVEEGWVRAAQSAGLWQPPRLLACLLQVS